MIALTPNMSIFYYALPVDYLDSTEAVPAPAAYWVCAENFLTLQVDIDHASAPLP